MDIYDHRPPTRPAQDDPLQQCGALAWRTRAAPRVIRGKALLVGQIGLPADIGRMMALDHHRPHRPRALDRPRPDRSIGIHDPARMKTSKDVRAGVRRIGEQSDGPTVRQAPPPNLSGPGTAIRASGEEPRPEVGHDAVGGAPGFKRRKHLGHGRADLLVGIEDRLPVVVIEVADRQRTSQLAASRRRPFRLLQPTGEDVQLGLRHGPLQAEQKAIVKIL